MDYISRDIREAKIAPTIAVRELRVVDSQQVQNRGMDVMHMHRLLNRLPRTIKLRNSGVPGDYSGRTKYNLCCASSTIGFDIVKANVSIRQIEVPDSRASDMFSPAFNFLDILPTQRALSCNRARIGSIGSKGLIEILCSISSCKLLGFYTSAFELAIIFERSSLWSRST